MKTENIRPLILFAQQIVKNNQTVFNLHLQRQQPFRMISSNSLAEKLPIVCSIQEIKKRQFSTFSMQMSPSHSERIKFSKFLHLPIFRTFKTKRGVGGIGVKVASSSTSPISFLEYFKMLGKPKTLDSLLKSEEDAEKRKKILDSYREGLTTPAYSLRLLSFAKNVLIITFIFYASFQMFKHTLEKAFKINSSSKDSSDKSTTDSDNKSNGMPNQGNPLVNMITNHNFSIAKDINTKFSDVIGNEEAKEELKNIVHFLRDPKKFDEIGAKLPKGVLLTGPPGVGKTLLARAVAGEAGVSFIHTSGSDFEEMFVGVGANKIRKLFRLARLHAPCIVFIDEVDSVGGKRSGESVDPYSSQTINQLLNEMDGFQPNEGVLVLAATNRADTLDKALLRPGRFDTQVSVSLPNLQERMDLFQFYLKSVKHNLEEINLCDLAAGTARFSGADIMNIVNRSAIEASLTHRERVIMDDLWSARDKLMIGPARKRFPNEEENLHTAYREAANALVTIYTEDATPLHRVSIVPHNLNVGYTSYLPERDEYGQAVSQIKAKMDVSLAGRIAEELKFGTDHVTSAAANSAWKASDLARSMITLYGMSPLFGPRALEKDEKLSDEFKKLVDKEITRLLKESTDRVCKLLTEHTKELDLLAEALMKYETLDKDDVTTVLSGGVPRVGKIVSKLGINSKNGPDLNPLPTNN